MSKDIASLFVLVGFLFAANHGHADTNLVSSNLVNRILAEAEFHRDPSRAKLEVQAALASATLVIRGFVVNSNAVATASHDQTEVTPGQGWCGITIRPQEVLHGKCDEGDIFMDTLYSGFQVDSSVFPQKYSFTNDENCIFLLKPKVDLSRWCKTNAFEQVKVVPLKLVVPSKPIVH